MEDTRGTTLITTVEKATDATAYHLQDKGTLELTGTGSFSNTVEGAGTLKVSSGADVSFAIQNHTVTWNPEVTLRVEGSATIGAAETYELNNTFSGTDKVIATSIGNKVEINGGNLKVVYDARTTSDNMMSYSPFSLPSLTLGNQGTLELLPQLSEWGQWKDNNTPPGITTIIHNVILLP